MTIDGTVVAGVCKSVAGPCSMPKRPRKELREA